MLPVVFCLAPDAGVCCFSVAGCLSLAAGLAVGVLTITLRPPLSCASTLLWAVALLAAFDPASALGGTATRVPVTILCTGGFSFVAGLAGADSFGATGRALGFTSDGLSVDVVATVRATTVFLGVAGEGAGVTFTALRGARGLYSPLIML